MRSSSFGKSKIYTALVIDIHQNKPALYDAKEIHQILENNQSLLKFKLHMEMVASYYMCSIGDVYRAMPSAFAESETVFLKKTNTIADTSLLSDDEFLFTKLCNSKVL
jgi:primosomal protein N' (replication factor Y)